MTAREDQEACTSNLTFSSLFEEDGIRYRVRYNVTDDRQKHEYQLLRSQIFEH